MLGLSLYLILMAPLLVSSDTINCDTGGILVYEDMGCGEVYRGDEECPVRYLCNFGEVGNCYFRNQIYKVGESIPNYLLGETCLTNCACGEDFVFECETIECSFGTLDPGCYTQYRLDQCCSLEEEYCPVGEVGHCNASGSLYVEREVFVRESNCRRCICERDGNYTCKRTTCVSQIKYGLEVIKRCAPLYESGVDESGSLCCPSRWICPEEVTLPERVDVGDDDDGDEIGMTCSFGTTTFQLGEHFSDSSTMTTCTCKIPPLMTCTSAD